MSAVPMLLPSSGWLPRRIGSVARAWPELRASWARLPELGRAGAGASYTRPTHPASLQANRLQLAMVLGDRGREGPPSSWVNMGV